MERISEYIGKRSFTKRGSFRRRVPVAFICLAVLLTALFPPGPATAKSLYVISNIAADPQEPYTPIAAYDIRGDTIAPQAAQTIMGMTGAGIAVDTASKILFVTSLGSEVYLVDAVSFNLLGAVTTPGVTRGLVGIVVDQGKSKVYAVDRGTPNLYVYNWNAASKTLTTDITVPLPNLTRGYGLALDETQSRLYVTDNTRTVRYYNTNTWQMEGSIRVADQRAVGIAVDAARGCLYTGQAYNSLNLLCRVDLNSGAQTSVNIGVAQNVRGVAVDSDTGLIYVTVGTDWLPTGNEKIMVFGYNGAQLEYKYELPNQGSPGGLCVPDAEISYNPLRLSKDDGIRAGRCVVPGDTITYTLTYSNPHPFEYPGVTLVDRLPAGVNFVSATGGGTPSPDGRRVTWNIGTVGPNAPPTSLQLIVQVDPGVVSSSNLRNSATITINYEQGSTRTTQNVYTSVCGPISITHSFGGNLSDDEEMDESDYFMLSVPGVIELEDRDPFVVFGGADPLDEYDPYQMRIFQYYTTDRVYREYPDVAPADGGEGYWVISTESREIQYDGRRINTGTFNAVLYPGWNLVGYPFLNPIPWNNLVVVQDADEYPILSPQNVWVEHQAWGFNKGYFAVGAGDRLQPWRAYWMNNLTGQPVTVLIPPPPTVGSAPVKNPAASVGRKGVSFTLNEKSRAYKDKSLFVGVEEGARFGHDTLDCKSPPPISSRVPRIYVNNAGWEKARGKYATDIRPIGAGSVKFPIAVQSPRKEGPTTYVLRWTLRNLPADYKVTLTDNLTGKSMNMRFRNEYNFTVPAKAGLRRLVVTMEKR